MYKVSISQSLLLVCHLLELPNVFWIRERPWSQMASILQQHADALVGFCFAKVTIASGKYDVPLRHNLQGVNIQPEHPSFVPSSSSFRFILSDCLLSGHCQVPPSCRWQMGLWSSRRQNEEDTYGYVKRCVGSIWNWCELKSTINSTKLVQIQRWYMGKLMPPHTSLQLMAPSMSSCTCPRVFSPFLVCVYYYF